MPQLIEVIRSGYRVDGGRPMMSTVPLGGSAARYRIGNKPLPLIQQGLVAGSLKRLAMPEDPGGNYELAAVWRLEPPPELPPPA